MGKACCAVGCTNRFTKGSGVSFYRFPKDPARRGLWISAVGRKNWTPNAYSWICSVHFVSGEKSDDPLSPGYVPTLFAHTGSPVKLKAVGDMSRYRRSQVAKRRKICAEPGSSRSTSADEEDSESDTGNGACERSIMTDLSGEDILKLQDEVQLLRSENWSSFIYNVDGCLCMCICPCDNSPTSQSNNISAVGYGPDEERLIFACKGTLNFYKTPMPQQVQLMIPSGEAPRNGHAGLTTRPDTDRLKSGCLLVITDIYRICPYRSRARIEAGGQEDKSLIEAGSRTGRRESIPNRDRYASRSTRLRAKLVGNLS